MHSYAKLLIIVGVIFIVIGIFILFFPKINLFRLPGDIYIKKNNFSFYFPITTSIIISIILTIIFSLIRR